MKLKPLDLLSILTVVFLAVFSALPMLARNDGAFVEIITDTDTYTLPLEDNVTHTVTSKEHTLTVEIKDGSAKVIAHTCPDGLCEAMGEISDTNQTIVCLPAKTVIRVIGSDDEVLDGIAG